MGRKTTIALLIVALISAPLVAAQYLSWKRHSVTRFHTAEKVVCLTFDDGPDPRFTPQILATLRREHVPGTFFLIGSKVAQDAGRVDYSGETLGYHTFTHRPMWRMTPSEQIADFRRGAQSFPPSYSVGSGFYRPPRMQAWPATAKWADEHGTFLLWDVSYDKLIRRHSPNGEVDGTLKEHRERVKAVVLAVRPGSIVLMHDGNGDGRYLADDLPDIIDALKARGYRFITPDEGMKLRRYPSGYIR